MPKILDSMPEDGGRRYGGLRLPQVRVLQVLAAAKGPLTRSKVSSRCGNKTDVVVGRAVGYSDPTKRSAFEQTKDGGGEPGKPCPSLLTLGYVTEVEVDLDGVSETGLLITDKGRRALKALGELQLPPVHD